MRITSWQTHLYQNKKCVKSSARNLVINEITTKSTMQKNTPQNSLIQFRRQKKIDRSTRQHAEHNSPTDASAN